MTQQAPPPAQEEPDDGQVQVELTVEDAIALLHLMGLINAASYMTTTVSRIILPFLEQPIPVVLVPPAGQVLHLDVLATHGSRLLRKLLAKHELLQTVREFHAQPIPVVLVPPAGQVLHLDVLATHGSRLLRKLLAKHELLQTVREFHECKQEEGKSVSSYVLKMKSNIDNLECFGHSMSLNLAGLRGSRKLKPGALNLYMCNGHRAAVEAIGNFHLSLPSGLVVVLNNCHIAPSITRGIILVSRLYDDGFINRFEHDAILVSTNNLVYFHVVPRDGIYEIDLSNSNTNDSSMYVVSKKRAKLNLDFTLLWHYRLGDISKKQIKKLQHGGIFKSTDLESFDKCISCLSGKMARKPYSHQVEKANDLLGLIHTDICGLFRTVSRQRASYFVTFTDNFIHYGYVYMLKHKHEVFETFKVFHKEVENQLGYPKETMGYSFYYPPENKVFIARNAEFFENVLITQEASGSVEDLEIIQDEDTHLSENTSLHHNKDD
ncbi:retrotransposon protein, putative, ty1-copia subclass [Tanacetum coccineum]|uniref:Retrotransposon protein, putative, ty1-copia subclass n=1 Tax=Tanacetum coccineum TaxID=301880 RepID=A0ABQ5I643_9ASTR